MKSSEDQSALRSNVDQLPIDRTIKWVCDLCELKSASKSRGEQLPTRLGSITLKNVNAHGRRELLAFGESGDEMIV